MIVSSDHKRLGDFRVFHNARKQGVKHQTSRWPLRHAPRQAKISHTKLQGSWLYAAGKPVGTQCFRIGLATPLSSKRLFWTNGNHPKPVCGAWRSLDR